jgi:hypothetical protein
LTRRGPVYRGGPDGQSGLLDTPVGKAFVASGGIAAMNAKGALDETETAAKSVEDALEAAITKVSESGE